MTQIEEVQTSIGIFKIKRPSAGQRNQALAKAETSWGIKNSVMMAELLPKCIVNRPENIDDTTPINQILDSLELEDYDALVLALTKMIRDSSNIEEKKKKSSTSLIQEDSQKADLHVVG